MTQDSTVQPAESRRIFVSANGNTYQLFSITQRKTDCSIYFSAPNFSKIAWLIPVINNSNAPGLLTHQVGRDGKLSLHGSGVTHVRPYEGRAENDFEIRGHFLKNDSIQSYGLRHLVTFFISEPTHIPNSPALAKKSDYVIQTDKFEPMVIIFWAVPCTQPLTIKLQGSFQVEDLEEIPPRGGWGIFKMKTHDILWFAYRTKHMTRWPRDMQACYYDGNMVPILICTSEGAFRLELRVPKFALSGSELSIDFRGPEMPDDSLPEPDLSRPPGGGA